MRRLWNVLLQQHRQPVSIVPSLLASITRQPDLTSIYSGWGVTAVRRMATTEEQEAALRLVLSIGLEDNTARFVHIPMQSISMCYSGNAQLLSITPLSPADEIDILRTH